MQEQMEAGGCLQVYRPYIEVLLVEPGFELSGEEYEQQEVGAAKV